MKTVKPNSYLDQIDTNWSIPILDYLNLTREFITEDGTSVSGK